MDIDEFVLDDILGRKVDFWLDHEEFLFSVEQIMEGEFGDVGTFHKKVEASSGPHGGAHGGEDRKTIVVFVGILEVFLSEGI